MTRNQTKWYLQSYLQQSEYLELQLQQLLDIISMNPNFSSIRTKDLLQVLEEVRNMDGLPVQ